MNIILTVIVFIIFSSVAYYMYKKFFKPSKSFITNNEFINVNNKKITQSFILEIAKNDELKASKLISLFDKYYKI